MDRCKIYAENVIDSLNIGQLTIKDIKKLIMQAWEDGYKAGKNHKTADDNSSPTEDSGRIIKEIHKKDIKKDDKYPPYTPNVPWPQLPPEPYVFPGHAPWLPIIYC